MKLPLSWLAHYVSLPPVDELLARLTAIGFMQDGFTRLPDGQSIASLEVRQNRPDCLSIFGLAREVAAAFNSPLREVTLANLPHEVHESENETPDYICFLRIKDTRLDGLPREMLTMLEQYGQGSVNPFVDLSNYIMIELGQPLHIYSASEIDVESARTRQAQGGEQLRLINGEAVVLAENDLIIADRSGPLALAGVMGGEASKVLASNGDIIVEAGNFRPAFVRRTARRHGLSTEASQRSSKLLAPTLVTVALRRFLALLSQYGHVGEIELWQKGSMPVQRSEPIVLAYQDIERISGVWLPIEQARDILISLGFTHVEIIQNTKIAVLPPWWRTDVDHPADLIEEVLRIDGYNKIPLTPLEVIPPSTNSDHVWEQEEAVRNLLCAWGYDEAILDTFLVDPVGSFENRPDVVRVENSPAANMDILRPSLIPNLLSSARFLPFLLPQRRLFEIGRTFHLEGGQPVERRTVAWVNMLGSGPASWHHSTIQPDFYTMKAEAEAMLGLQISSENSSPAPFPFLAKKSCCLIDKSGQARGVVGYVGEVEHQAYDLKAVRKSFAVEIYLPPPTIKQAKHTNAPRREVDSFDLSILVDENTSASNVQELIEVALGEDLVTVRLLDIYTGKQIRAGFHSFTFRVVYDRERNEPGAVWEQVGKAITQQLNAEIRGANHP